MMLLSYSPFDVQTVRIARNVGEYSKPSQQTALTDEVLVNSSALEMNVHILFISVKNFYESVLGYETNKTFKPRKSRLVYLISALQNTTKSCTYCLHVTGRVTAEEEYMC